MCRFNPKFQLHLKQIFHIPIPKELILSPEKKNCLPIKLGLNDFY